MEATSLRLTTAFGNAETYPSCSFCGYSKKDLIILNGPVDGSTSRISRRRRKEFGALVRGALELKPIEVRPVLGPAEICCGILRLSRCEAAGKDGTDYNYEEY